MVTVTAGMHIPPCKSLSQHVELARRELGLRFVDLGRFADDVLRDWEDEQIATDIQTDPRVAALYGVVEQHKARAGFKDRAA